jgi:Protein of unknown function (DUF3995)
MNNLFTVSQTLNTFIFIVIAGFHFYWAFGGKLGSQAVIPQIEGKLAFQPPILATVFVALAMLVGAWLSWQATNSMIFIYGNLLIAVVMLLRAVGDFKYVGFFKKIKGTLFAQNDTKYYSPLCLLISANAFYIYFNIK